MEISIKSKTKHKGKKVEQNHSSDCSAFIEHLLCAGSSWWSTKGTKVNETALSPGNSQVGKWFLRLWPEHPLCRITQGTSEKWKKEDFSRPLLMQNVWESPLLTISLVGGHACWGLRTSRGEADLATANSAVMFQCSHRLGRSWDIKSGDFGTNRPEFSGWLARSLVELSHLSKPQLYHWCHGSNAPYLRVVLR